MATASSKRRAVFDPTVYPSEDHMGEGALQRFICELFRMLLERWLTANGKATFVGANQFIYWKQFDPSKNIAPDVFVLPGVAVGIPIKSWKTWETGIVPSFALEVASDDPLKDSRDGPAIYDELGVRELVIFDPEYETVPSERLRFQVYRRLPKRGLVRVDATNDDRMRSRTLGCWLRSVEAEPGIVRLRLATGAAGDDLIPTAEESEQSARAAEQAAVSARAATDAETEKLRAEIARIRAKRK